jgi:hypothetical protein
MPLVVLYTFLRTTLLLYEPGPFAAAWTFPRSRAALYSWLLSELRRAIPRLLPRKGRHANAGFDCPFSL